MRIMKIKMRNTMRKLMMLWMVACICQLGYGQRNVDQLFKTFRGESDVTSVRIGSFAMRLASLFTDTYGVRGVDVLALDDCDGAVKERFSAAVRDLRDADYETMLTSNEDGERTRILVRIEDDLIRELVIVTTGDDNALVRIKGKISPADVERVINEHANGDS